MATLFQIIQFLDGNGNPLSGGKLYWRAAGTTTPQDTWIDEAESAIAPNPIILDAEGRISIGQNGAWIRGSYKLTITDSNDSVVPGGTIDNLNEYDQRDWTGLTASITDLNSTTTTATIVTGNTTVVLGDRNKTILADATSGDIDINLPTSAAVGDTYRIFIKKIDNSKNIVHINPQGSETIDLRSTEYNLRTLNAEIGLQNDGNNWYSISLNERKNFRTDTALTATTADLEDDHSIIVAEPTAAMTITLPNPTSVGRGYRVTVKNISATASVTVLPNGVEVIDGQTSLPIAERFVSYTLITEGDEWYIESSHDVNASVPLPRGYLSGMVIDRHAPDLAHDTEILPGVARSLSDSVNLKLTTALVKRTDASWVEGTNSGGFPDNISLSINTWYAVFAIAKLDGTTDGGYDDNINATNLLRVGGPAYIAGYRVYRRVGFILTDASNNIVPYYSYFSDTERTFWWVTPINDFLDGPLLASATRTIRSPNLLALKAQISATLQCSQNIATSVFFNRPGLPLIDDPNNGITSLFVGPNASSPSGETSTANIFTLQTDSSGQIQYKATGAIGVVTVDLAVATLGWTDDLST